MADRNDADSRGESVHINGRYKLLKERKIEEGVKRADVEQKHRKGGRTSPKLSQVGQHRYAKQREKEIISAFDAEAEQAECEPVKIAFAQVLSNRGNEIASDDSTQAVSVSLQRRRERRPETTQFVDRRSFLDRPIQQRSVRHGRNIGSVRAGVPVLDPERILQGLEYFVEPNITLKTVYIVGDGYR